MAAEDDAADQELLRRTLSDRCVLRLVDDGVMLLDYLNQCTQGTSDDYTRLPDLILLDLNMPRMDGREALVEIRRICAGKSTPIVVFSTSGDVADAKRCYEAGCNTYVTKPGELLSYRASLSLILTYWLDLATLP